MISSRTKRPLSTGRERRTNERTTNMACLREIWRSDRTSSRTKARNVRLFGLSLSLRESPYERGTCTVTTYSLFGNDFQACVLPASATTISQCYLSSNQPSYHQVLARCVENFSNTRVADHHNYNMMD